MNLKPSKLYLIFSVTLVSGYLWLCFSTIALHFHPGVLSGPCLIKHITGVPCPSCGSTRSVMELMHGNLSQAFYLNPFGILIALFMLVMPFWIAFDFLSKRRTIYEFYCRAEIFLRKPTVAVPLIIMVLINWIWNISKGL